MGQAKEKSRAFVNPRKSLFPLVWSYLTNLFDTALILNSIRILLNIYVSSIHISPIILLYTSAVTPLLVLLFRTIEVKDSKPKHKKIWLLKLSDKIVDWYRKNIKNHWIAKLIWNIVLLFVEICCFCTLLTYFDTSLEPLYISLVSQLSIVGGTLSLTDQISNYFLKDIEDPHRLIKIAYNVLLYAIIGIVTISSLNPEITILGINFVLLCKFLIAINAFKAICEAHPPAAQYNKKQYQVDISEYDKAILKYWGNIHLKKNTNIIIPHGIYSIDEGAFEDFKNLTSITIPNSVIYIGRSAFKNCTSLTSITIADSVTSIGPCAFQNCSNLTSITIPDSVTSIEESTFQECKNLTSITIPNSVIYIGRSAFKNCTSLTSVTIPNSISEIRRSTFYGCSSLASITIHDSVTLIDDYAFGDCSSLTSITIPNNNTRIEFYAFKNCESLSLIIIPTTMENIDQSDWNRRIDLGETTVITRNQLSTWASNRKLSHSHTNSELAILYQLENSATDIRNSAYKDCSSLTSITIPDNTTAIRRRAFEGCSRLTSITIPESVTFIGQYAFTGCSSLTTINIPDGGVTFIGTWAFDGCTSLTSITIPDNITAIRTGAFNYCKSLTSITIPEGVTSIGAYAFAYCSSLTSITIPEGVISIGANAFAYCSSLTSITIPNSVTKIHRCAFISCISLTSITISDSVTSIGSWAFAGCSSLRFVIIPTNLESKNEIYWENTQIDLQQTTLITRNQLSSWANNQKLSSTYTYRELAVLYQLQKDDNFTPTWPELGKLAPNLLMDDLLIVLPSEKRHIVLPRTYTSQPNSVCLENHSLFSVVPVEHRQEELRTHENPDDPTQTIQLQEVNPAASSAILRWLTLKDMATYLSAKASSRLKPIHPLTTQQARPVLQG